MSITTLQLYPITSSIIFKLFLRFNLTKGRMGSVQARNKYDFLSFVLAIELKDFILNNDY